VPEAAETSPAAGSEGLMPADLVLLAIGFDGVASASLVESLGARSPTRGDRGGCRLLRRAGVFASGDATRGASLIVWRSRRAPGGGRLRPLPGSLPKS